jgi:hypothetical protein
MEATYRLRLYLQRDKPLTANGRFAASLQSIIGATLILRSIAAPAFSTKVPLFQRFSLSAFL